MSSQTVDYLQQLQIKAADLGLDLLQGIIVFLAFLAVALVARKAIRAAIGRLSTQGHVDHIVAQLAYAVTVAVGAIVALSATGRVNVAALVTSLGLAGFAVGFAVKDVLGNFLAGVLILVQRPFTIGDEIALTGAEGRVESIRVRDTLIRTGEGSLLYVPNGIVFNSIVANKSASDVRLVTCRFSCDYQADIGEVRDISSSRLAGNKSILKSPAPQVLLTDPTDNGLAFLIKFWIDPSESSAEAQKSAVLEGIIGELRQRGILARPTSEATGEESP